MTDLLRGRPRVPHPSCPRCGRGTDSPAVTGLARKLQITACSVLPPKPWRDPRCGPRVLPRVSDQRRPADTRMCFSALIFPSTTTILQSSLPTVTWGCICFCLHAQLATALSWSHALRAACLTRDAPLSFPKPP